MTTNFQVDVIVIPEFPLKFVYHSSDRFDSSRILLCIYCLYMLYWVFKTGCQHCNSLKSRLDFTQITPQKVQDIFYSCVNLIITKPFFSLKLILTLWLSIDWRKVTISTIKQNDWFKLDQNSIFIWSLPRLVWIGRVEILLNSGRVSSR